MRSIHLSEPIFILKKNLLILSTSILLLNACTTTPTVTPTLEPTETRTAIFLGPTPSPTSASSTATPIPPRPTPVPIPSITEHDWARGPVNAPVTFLIYSDFQCPYCARLHPVLNQLLELHPNDLRVVFRHFPLISIHDKANLAGQAAEISGLQGKFWEMHDLLFEKQAEWKNLNSDEFIQWLELQYLELDLDQEIFTEQIGGYEATVAMEEHFLRGITYGLSATPTIFINGYYYQLEPSLTMLEANIRLALLDQVRQSTYPLHTLAEGKTYIAHLHLNIGDVTIQLYPDAAPLAVNNFIYLSNQGWYDDNPIYRVNPGKLVESGDPSGTGIGDQGYHFTIETDPALVFDKPGLVALSSSGPNTSSSRFFITLAALPEFDGTRTIFGRVIEGLDLLTDLRAREPMEELLSPPQATIISITIEEK